MATSAYLLIKASEACRHNGYLKAIDSLRELPEVDYVEPVSGLYDCVAKVEAPTRLIFLVHKIMAKSWVERVHVLSVDEPVQTALESEEARTARLMRQRQIIEAYRAGLPRPPVPAPELHPGPTGAEKAWATRLMRQREIIKAHFQKRTRATTAPAVGVDEPVQAAPESEEARTARLMRQRQIIKAYRAGLPRPPVPAPELHPGPTGAEKAWATRRSCASGRSSRLTSRSAPVARWPPFGRRGVEPSEQR
ncbi:MAG: hypothetical protein ACUVV3_06485 [Dehalococcoidia bacterium]